MAPEARENGKEAAPPRRVLFVCIGNSCRSQMAEALARHLAADVIEPASAGLSPLGHIAEPARKVLLERGASPEGQYSKGLADTEVAGVDLIVNMTGMPGPAVFPSPRPPVVDWDVEDPFGEHLEVYRRVCEGIEEKVLGLAATLRASESPISNV